MSSSQEDLIYDCIVLGAGPQGLVSAKTYLQCSPSANLLLLDSQPTLGGTWAPSRLYPGLTTQNPISQYEFTDFPMSSDWIKSGKKYEYIPGSEVSRYLQQYAEHYHLVERCRFGEMIDQVERNSAGWMVLTSLILGEGLVEGRRHVYYTKQLIVATGMSFNPKLPAPFPGQSEFEMDGGRVFHCKYVPQQLEFLKSDEVRSIVVLGGGKYSVDMVTMCAGLGKKVEWVIRPSSQAGSGSKCTYPETTRGHPDGGGPVSGEVGQSDVGAAKMHPNMYDTSSWGYWFWQSGRFWLGYWIMGLYWRIMGWVTNMTSRSVENLREAKVELARNGCFLSAAAIMQTPTMMEVLSDPAKVTIHRASITKLEAGVVNLTSTHGLNRTISTIPSTAVILATGWNAPYPFFSDSLKMELGLPVPISSYPANLHQHWEELDQAADKELLAKLPFLKYSPLDSSPLTHTQFRQYRYIVPTAHFSPSFPPHLRNIVFGGTAQANLHILSAEMQAIWGVAYLLSSASPDLYPLPTLPKSLNEAEYHTALQTRFQERKYPGRGREIPSLLWEYIGYTDALLNDIGLQGRGMGLWTIQSPRLYSGVVEEWLRRGRTEIDGRENKKVV
ncbi:FAD/NAD(P)-binding domain-containing protein [Ascobolus immersus RN42]|uniref:FAD/NAD(P)-binding domain-containing protein n=1 Tax=Ascobolus immersus RN42 TaxID=1160509 RepID=A0A3N4I7K2_ASCIM|nr:FAD/NAD(P)-binding domain-containing protein [Ascobolus immersus RN42]